MEIYEAAAQRALPGVAVAALQDGKVDAVLHFSRRSAELLIGLADAAGILDRLIAIPQVCISKDAATPFIELESRVIVAREPTSAGLFAALDFV